MPIDPPATAVAPCPICHQKLRQTADVCPSCGAEKHYGPSRGESIKSTLVGLIATPAVTAILTMDRFVLVCVAIAGAIGGFYVAHNKYGVDRWVVPKKS